MLYEQIVERIKAVPYETKLLVLDPEADLYYRERDIMVSSSQSNVVFIKTPAAPRARNESSDDDDDDYEVKLRSKGSRVCDTVIGSSILLFRIVVSNRSAHHIRFIHVGPAYHLHSQSVIPSSCALIHLCTGFSFFLEIVSFHEKTKRQILLLLFFPRKLDIIG